MFYNPLPLFLFFKDIKKETNPMFYSNSNGDKNYVIQLVIPKIVTLSKKYVKKVKSVVIFDLMIQKSDVIFDLMIQKSNVISNHVIQKYDVRLVVL